VTTDDDTWYARDVVVATGPHGRPAVPPGFDPHDLGEVDVVAARDYRNPDRIAPGAVLVVGASASGVQIADELARAGRRVTLAVGSHTRMPRTYRGLDVYWWLEATGRLARSLSEHRDPEAALREPSLQLTGHRRGDRPDSAVDLAALQARGVRLTGRLTAVSGAVARFADDLTLDLARADATMHRFLDAVDRYVRAVGLSSEVWEPVRPAPVRVPGTPSRLDLVAEGITTVVLATGYRPDHSWLHLPVLAADGRILQDGGVTALPGLFTVGQRFQVTRASGLVAGAGQDAAAVVDHLLGRATEARVTPESAA
jgi:putative flavoprotein involved in K+ transport